MECLTVSERIEDGAILDHEEEPGINFDVCRGYAKIHSPSPLPWKRPQEGKHNPGRPRYDLVESEVNLFSLSIRVI